MNGHLLTIERLRIESTDARRRPDAPLLHDVSIHVERGEVLGLIGESGAGKSTLGLAAMGYVRPGCRIAGGRILLDGTDLVGLSPNALRRIRGARIAYIAQSPAAAFNPSKRLGLQVAESLILHRGVSRKAALQRAASLFEELDLPAPGQFGTRFPHQVSGGQLQRAMIAMALACEPELLILDEPTTALDVVTQVEVLAVIRATLQRHQASAIYISHDLALVAQFAHRVLVLRHGREVETGTTDDVLRQPAQGYTRRLLHAHQGTGGTAAGRPAAIPAEAAALAIQSLSASYRTLPGVLQDISFTIEKGKTLAVVGMSGSGKSTLARVICGLLPQDKGVISFFGTPLPRSLAQRSREQLRRIQLVYQHPDTALNPRQTVRRILGRAVSLHTSDGRVAVRARVDALLDMVGLSPEYADKRPPQLSGGQKQRIGIARALAARPDVILLDEATSALDPLIAEDILTLLQDLQRATGIAYIVITHDIGVVRRLADEVVVLRHGRVVAQGPISDVFAAPLHPYTELLLSAVPQMRPDWLTDVLAARADTLTIHPRRETKADLADASHAPS